MLPTGIVLTQFAAPVATTSNKTSQVPLAGISAPDIETEESPALPVNTAVPAQVVCAFGGFANVMPVGNGSVRLIPVNAISPPFDRRTITVDIPPDETLLGVNVLVAEREDVYVMRCVLELIGPIAFGVPLPKVCVPAIVAVLS